MQDKTLGLEEFNKLFKPIDEPEMDEGYTWQFEESSEATEVAKKFDSERPYRHIWTAVDGGGIDILLQNGYHMCNRLFYIVCETPWGDGTDTDKDVYIEAEY